MILNANSVNAVLVPAISIRTKSSETDKKFEAWQAQINKLDIASCYGTIAINLQETEKNDRAFFQYKLNHRSILALKMAANLRCGVHSSARFLPNEIFGRIFEFLDSERLNSLKYRH